MHACTHPQANCILRITIIDFGCTDCILARIYDGEGEYQTVFIGCEKCYMVLFKWCGIGKRLVVVVALLSEKNDELDALHSSNRT